MKYRTWMKKLCVIAIAGCMTLSSMPLTIYAEPTDTEAEEVEDVEISEGAIYLSSAEDIVTLAENCVDDAWSVDKVVVLKNDIDMSGVDFTGIPTFGGIFIGQGYIISGLDMEQDMTVMGFFRYLQKSAVVDNVRLEAIVEADGSNNQIGGFAGINYGKIQNCTFVGLVSGTEQIGGIAGWNKTSGIIVNCEVEGVVHGQRYIGGVAGQNQGVIRRCLNNAQVNTTVDQNSIPMDMSAALALEMELSLDMDMSSFETNQSTDYATDIGGIAGTNTGVIRECVNDENVGYKKMGYNIGGIVGSQSGYVADCINYAEINGLDGVGGIVGYFKPNVVLEFGPNPLDTMSAEMNNMMSSMKEVMNDVQNMDIGSIDLSSMEDAMGVLEESAIENEELDLDGLLESLEGIEDLEDLIDIDGNESGDSTGSSGNVDSTEDLGDILDDLGDSDLGDILDDLDGSGGEDSDLGDILDNLGDFDDGEDGLTDLDELLGDLMGDLEDGEIDESVDTSEDSINAALNDLSNSFGNLWNDSSEEGFVSDTSDISAAMDDMMASMDGMMNSMSSMNMSMEFNIVDVSRLDTETNKIAKVENCVNYGKVLGDTYIAGIVGLADMEMTSLMEAMGEESELSTSAECVVRLVVRDCKNYATISASKEYAGGIVGEMVYGAVISGKNTGNIDALNANYVGGIAGSCESIIMDSYSKCIMAGADYVGGIAGYGVEVADSYAFSDIAAYTKCAGGVLGNAKALPNETEGLIQNVRYYLVGKDLGAIDGINYAGATSRITLDEYLALENLDDMFKSVKVHFAIEGQPDVVLNVDMGGTIALSEVPIVEVEDSDRYDWKYVKPVTSETLGMNEVEEIFYLSEERLSNILFNQKYEAVVDAKHMVSEGENKTAENKNVILAIGAFDKETTVKLTDALQGESIINDVAVSENWLVELSNIGVEKLHYRIPEGMESDAIQLFVKDASGTWVEREYMVEGSYIIFDFTDGEMGFALAQVVDYGMYIGIAAGVAVLILLFVLIKRRQKVVKKVNKE